MALLKFSRIWVVFPSIVVFTGKKKTYLLASYPSDHSWILSSKPVLSQLSNQATKQRSECWPGYGKVLIATSFGHCESRFPPELSRRWDLSHLRFARSRRKPHEGSRTTQEKRNTCHSACDCLTLLALPGQEAIANRNVCVAGNKFSFS